MQEDSDYESPDGEVLYHTNEDSCIIFDSVIEENVSVDCEITNLQLRDYAFIEVANIGSAGFGACSVTGAAIDDGHIELVGLLEPYINSEEDPVTEDYTAYYNCGALFRVSGTATYGQSFVLDFDANGTEVELTIKTAYERDTSSSESEDVIADEETEVNSVMRTLLSMAGIAAATSVWFMVF